MPSILLLLVLFAFEVLFRNAPANGSIECMVGSVLKGVWIGFCIAAPVGPIGILVLKQALQHGRGAGLASGFGAALADLVYGFLAVAGVRLVAGQGRTVAVTGGFVLLWLAWRFWRETPSEDASVMVRKSGLSGAATTFALTLSNPMTILSFAAIVASTGTDAPALFVTGIFVGSMLWWATLSLTAVWLRAWIELQGVVLNRVAAVTLAGFGFWAIWGRSLN